MHRISSSKPRDDSSHFNSPPRRFINNETLFIFTKTLCSETLLNQAEELLVGYSCSAALVLQLATLALHYTIHNAHSPCLSSSPSLIGNTVGRNLLEVAVALRQTEALLCHDLKFIVLRMPICSYIKYLFYGFMIPEDMLMLVVNFIVDIVLDLLQF
ncbi:unnamed protein product [Vicia faba]|uniref:Uncharacterized protein n=1 Tax=Vicia faba TaxID=3906 RepID=A0AAV0ZQ41_VICFA|nr:unnamed protein product [Vicia faba]